MRLVLELFPTADGRVEGWIAGADADRQLFFSGWLELLRLLETSTASSTASARAAERSR